MLRHPTMTPAEATAPAVTDGVVDVAETPTAETTDTVEGTEADALRQIVQEQYARGEISEAEFDDMMELIDQQEEESAGNEQFSIRGDFAAELEEWFKNTTHEQRKVSGKRFLVGTTTDVLKSIGVPDYNIYFGGAKIEKILSGNASMTLDVVKDAVNLLESPILIMESQTVDDSIVLFGEAYTTENKPVMISVLLNPKTKSGEVLDYAVVTSAYGRRISNLQHLIDKSKIYYVCQEKNRTDKWLKALGLQLPSAITKYGSINSINNDSRNVNEQFGISDQVSKQDVVSDLREILRRGGDPAELRRYVENMERSTETAAETNTTDSQDVEAQEILNAAREQNISVNEYLRRNWEQYEYDGQLNDAARTALDQEKGNVQYSISSEELQDIQNIGRKSVNDFTAADIAKTERFAQQYWNEMGVKSPFFRAWFGDWRANDQTEVRVANVKGDARGVQMNADTGWDIQVSGQVFNETIRHTKSYNVGARKYLPYINSIVENAVLLDTYGLDPDKLKSNNSLLMHSLYAVADTGSGPEILKLYVEEMNDPNKENTSKRAYQLQNVEKYQPQNGSSQNNVSSISSATGTIHTVADLFAAVKQIDAAFNPKQASKVVNEDGTPMPVYHGTSDQFTEFKHSELSIREGSFFFAQNKEDAEGYTSNGRVMEVYVNLQNPIDYNDMPSYIYKLKDKKAQVDALRQLGYDGWMCDMETGWGEVSAFNSNQIKSATDNIGTFDGSNPDIRYSISENQSGEQSETIDEDMSEDPRSGLPRKAQDFLKRAENKLLNDLGEKLSVPKFARREYLRPIVQELSNEYLRTGI